MRNPKQFRQLVLPQQICPMDAIIKRKPFNIVNPYIEELKAIYSNDQQIENHIDELVSIFHKANLHFLIELSTKMSPSDFKGFLSQLHLQRKEVDENIVQRGKKPQYQFILVQGLVSYNIKSQTEEQSMLQVGFGYPGFVIYPQIFMAPKYANFTIKCQSECTFLTLNEELYNRFLKKLMIKEVDRLAEFLSQVSIFDGMGTLNIRKYLAYFIPTSFKYNEVIYQTGSEADEIFFILRGEVQIYTSKAQNHINIVTLGHGELFGLDEDDQVLNMRKFNAKCRESDVKVVVLKRNVFRMIQQQNSRVIQNCKNYLQRIDKLHSSLVVKNIKVLDNKKQICRKVIKRKKKKVKTNPNSLVWWGLVENLKTEHKYRMPSPPHLLASGREAQEQKSKTSLIAHKINQLRKRILESEQNDGESSFDEQENHLSSPYKTNGNYVPKIKTRIKMLQARPKAIDMTEVVKKKLVTYARNVGSFCDRLNLQ